MGFAPMDDDDPKLSRFALISPEDYHCQVILRSKKCLFEHPLCPRLDAENLTLNGLFCGYDFLVCHEIFSPLDFSFAIS